MTPVYRTVQEGLSILCHRFQKNLNALKLLIYKFTSCLTPTACEELKGKKEADNLH